MDKYRIIEETGNFTGAKRFYIESLSNRLFGEPKWRAVYQYHPEVNKRMIEFDTLKEAEDWIKYKIETVSRKIHNTFTT